MDTRTESLIIKALNLSTEAAWAWGDACLAFGCRPVGSRAYASAPKVKEFLRECIDSKIAEDLEDLPSEYNLGKWVRLAHFCPNALREQYSVSALQAALQVCANKFSPGWEVPEEVDSLSSGGISKVLEIACKRSGYKARALTAAEIYRQFRKRLSPGQPRMTAPTSLSQLPVGVDIDKAKVYIAKSRNATNMTSGVYDQIIEDPGLSIDERLDLIEDGLDWSDSHTTKLRTALKGIRDEVKRKSNGVRE